MTTTKMELPQFFFFQFLFSKFYVYYLSNIANAQLAFYKFKNTVKCSLFLIFLKIPDNEQTLFSNFVKNFFLDWNINLFDLHTKGSGFTLKLILILLIISILLFFVNVKSFKLLLLNKKNFFFNPFILWVLAWLIDILILSIRFFFFNDKFLDLQFIFVPSILVWILFRIFFFKKFSSNNLQVDFLNDWLNYQLKFKLADIFFKKISKSKDLDKSKLFYWSIQIFILDLTICTLRILIYGCLILGRLDFTISFFLFIMMIHIYKKKLKK